MSSPWSRIGFLLAQPGVALTLLALAGVIALGLARGRRGRIVAVALLLGGVLPQAALLVVPLDAWVVRPLEAWYPRLSTPPGHVDGIIVLGGAHRLSVSRDRQTPGLNADAERMTEFLALARRYPEARLVYSGGMERGGWREEDAARLLFDRFGLSERVRFENRSRNTWENALFSQRMLAPRPGEVWVLVTSAAHMPRAVAAFRAAGWTGLLPDPVAYRSPSRSGWGPGLGVSARLSVLDAAMHEWLGLLAYRIRGEAAFPPADPPGG